jgi:hypothetical protein
MQSSHDSLALRGSPVTYLPAPELEPHLDREVSVLCLERGAMDWLHPLVVSTLGTVRWPYGREGSGPRTPVDFPLAGRGAIPAASMQLIGAGVPSSSLKKSLWGGLGSCRGVRRARIERIDGWGAFDAQDSPTEAFTWSPLALPFQSAP